MEKETCPECGGTGEDPWHEDEACPYCDGDGEVEVEEELRYG